MGDVFNRAPKTDETPWSVSRIASDPAGAFDHMRALIDQRHAWHRKFDRLEREFRHFKRDLKASAQAGGEL